MASRSRAVEGSRHSGDVLLETASRLMTEGDTINVTFVEIARASGLNSALIHYRFGGKHGLFRALIERDVGAGLDGLEALVAADMGAAEKLERHVVGVVRLFARNPYLSRLIAALAVETEGDSARFLSERLTRPVAAAQRAILQQGEAEGVFRAVDPMLFYMTLIGACDHPFVARGALKWVFGIERVDDALAERHARHVAATMLDGVRR